ncbi:Hypothetical predicted protein [Paramuricea clavata]|uniref:Uncharacterized protein n=1 Tax=Paramuricea clavata TaxID=317549 RepID=A0A6S7FZF6_PARCT|nr:Hypothetical predicted protein [Paramuricea clavata]
MGQTVYLVKFKTIDIQTKKLLNEALNQRSNVDESLSNWLEQMCKKSPTFKFWNIIAHYEILILIFVRAHRGRNFPLYVTVLEALVPLFFALDHVNDSRWLPVHIRDMKALPQEIKDEFETLNHQTIAKSLHTYSAIPIDQACEQVNKVVKASSGAMNSYIAGSCDSRGVEGNPIHSRSQLNPRNLNLALKRSHYPMRTVESVAARMPGASVFSTLDAKSGFWQITLDEKSSMLTTFGTPFGRFRYLRIPFGINTASEVFQRTMEQLFTGYPCEIIVDDILVWGSDITEHDYNLEKVLQRAKEVNLKLTTKKCKFRLESVSYVGHQFTKGGLKPDEDKIKAIKEMPAPDGPKALQRFLGMVNYLHKFIDNFSEKMALLRQLLNKDTKWSWDVHYQVAFEKLKKEISNPPVLKFFNPARQVVLSVDASKSGLGAVCLQDGSPVAYASRVMTETESRYTHIEKELLAAVFACTKFYDFTYGNKVGIETDHKPLITIVKKPLHIAPARLQ